MTELHLSDNGLWVCSCGSQLKNKSSIERHSKTQKHVGWEQSQPKTQAIIAVAPEPSREAQKTPLGGISTKKVDAIARKGFDVPGGKKRHRREYRKPSPWDHCQWSQCTGWTTKPPIFDGKFLCNHHHIEWKRNLPASVKAQRKLDFLRNQKHTVEELESEIVRVRRALFRDYWTAEKDDKGNVITSRSGRPIYRKRWDNERYLSDLKERLDVTILKKKEVVKAIPQTIQSSWGYFDPKILELAFKKEIRQLEEVEKAQRDLEQSFEEKILSQQNKREERELRKLARKKRQERRIAAQESIENQKKVLMAAEKRATAGIDGVSLLMKCPREGCVTTGLEGDICFRHTREVSIPVHQRIARPMKLHTPSQAQKKNDVKLPKELERKERYLWHPEDDVWDQLGI